MSDSVVIVGAGQAGFSAAAKLRALGYHGKLTVLGDEQFAPYQRPPLSKKYATGQLAAERLYFRPPQWFADHGVELRLGVKATAIDADRQQVIVAEGEAVPYGTLILATGARARQLPSGRCGPLNGVITLRSLADADRFSSRLNAGQSMVIVGGGFIGLEAASVAASKGLKVTVVEQAERILQRVVGVPTSDHFRALHALHGVDIRESAVLEGIVGKDGEVDAVLLEGGPSLPADTVLVGIGMQPNTELAVSAGLEIDGGIRVDEYGRTSGEAIYAAGDCAVFPWRGEQTRFESVHNAISQAEHVASVIMGVEEPYDPTPWFWSDQYDTKLQIAGYNRGYTDTVLRPGGKEHSFSLWYYRDDELLAVDAINDPLAYVVGKKNLEHGRSIPKSVVGDSTEDLKTWM